MSDVDTVELEPCPFCGGKADMSKDYDPDGSGAFYAIKCRKCRAKSSELYAVEACPIFFGQVRDAWNTRSIAALPPAVPDTTPDPVSEAAKVLLCHFKAAYTDAVDIQQMPVEQAPVLDVEYLRALIKDEKTDDVG